MNVRHKTDNELVYAASDIDAAISANPRTDNLSRYLIDRDACDNELAKRRSIRLFRANLNLKVDPLACKARERKPTDSVRYWRNLCRQIDGRNNCSFVKDCFLSSNWRLASFNRYGI